MGGEDVGEEVRGREEVGNTFSFLLIVGVSIGAMGSIFAEAVKLILSSGINGSGEVEIVGVGGAGKRDGEVIEEVV